MFKFGIVFGISLVLASASFARPPTDSEDEALSRTIAMFVSGMTARNAQDVADATIIPRVLEAQASALQIDQAALYASFLGNLDDFLANIEIADIEFDNDMIDIVDGLNNKWTWMDYNFTLTVEGDALDVRNRTLAIEENSDWYLVRVDEQNLPVLISLFPEIKFDNYGEAVISRAATE